MTDKVSEGDVADATRSHEVETKQTLAPTLEDGTLQTADDGEPNPPTGAASSITISPEQFDRVMSAVKRMNAEGMQKQARELMDTFLSAVNNDVSTIMTPPPSRANSGARGPFLYYRRQRLRELPHVAQLPSHHHAHKPTHTFEYASREQW